MFFYANEQNHGFFSPWHTFFWRESSDPCRRSVAAGQLFDSQSVLKLRSRHITITDLGALHTNWTRSVSEAAAVEDLNMTFFNQMAERENPKSIKY